ncbi:UDP-Glycosyltransferase/glycogen phosphorylase [Thozetella sp. PMI_491]|nr:UDP-Glycosyltransferase/glycogen phosphorylase [Thozetella sp. PMI_491]
MADAAPGQGGRPFLLFLSHALTGHLTPTLRVAESFRSRGWPVFFLGPTAHRARIINAGAEFLPLQGIADLDDLQYYSVDSPTPPVPGYWDMSWQDRAIVDMKLQWLEPIPVQWASVKDALQMLHDRDPARQVIVVTEAMFHGILPLFFGAPLPPGVSRPRTATLSVTVPLIRSADLPPFGFPLPFDQTQEGRARNAACWAHWAINSVWLSDLMLEKLGEAGCTHVASSDLIASAGINYLSHDTIMQLGVPSFYFPRSDWPPNFKFIGILPAAKEPATGWPNLPPWWDEVTRTKHGKKVVVVAQGTVEVNPNDLILPTIRAMERRDDVLVVAILGRKGATLPPDITLPPNTRVTDYLHYDAILPHAHAWVHNGGYGALQHGIAHGVPMVVGGEGQDKPENTKRIAYSGVGVDLCNPHPTVEETRGGIESVLDDPRFKERARVLQKESEDLDCFRLVEQEVLALVEHS